MEGTRGSSEKFGGTCPTARAEAVVMIGPTSGQSSLKPPAGHSYILGSAHRISPDWRASSGSNQHPSCPAPELPSISAAACQVRALLEHFMAILRPPAATKTERAAPWPSAEIRPHAHSPSQTEPALEPQHFVHQGGLWDLWGRAQDNHRPNLLSLQQFLWLPWVLQGTGEVATQRKG